MTKETLFARVEEQRAALLSMADDIYDHPELGFQEFHAQKVLTDYLKDCGFQVELGTGGVETAFRAEFSNGQGAPASVFCASTTPWRAWATPAATTCRARPSWGRPRP